MGFENLSPRQLQKIFMPFSFDATEKLKNTSKKFVHYTSAFVGLEILKNKEVWLRNSRIMNDFREMHHGQNCLSSAWNDKEIGGRFRKLLDGLHPTIGERLQDSLVSLYDDRNENTYLLSVSEHGNPKLDEDRYGRLSMWRAYGGKVNVAFVMHNGPFVGESDALMAFTSPVMYAEISKFREEFSRVISNVDAASEELANTDPEEVFRTAFVALHFAILATKHPGFTEEREWRILYSPSLWESDRLIADVKTVDDVPQKIFKLPLNNVPERGLTGIEIPELIDRIIIGPNQYPNQIREVFVKELEDCGVSDARDRVVVSDIPLRR